MGSPNATDVPTPQGHGNAEDAARVDATAAAIHGARGSYPNGWPGAERYSAEAEDRGGGP